MKVVVCGIRDIDIETISQLRSDGSLNFIQANTVVLGRDETTEVDEETIVVILDTTPINQKIYLEKLNLEMFRAGGILYFYTGSGVDYDFDDGIRFIHLFEGNIKGLFLSGLVERLPEVITEIMK